MMEFKFKPDYSVEQLERRFALEEMQGVLWEVNDVSR